MIALKLFVTPPSTADGTGPTQASDGVSVSGTTTYYSQRWGANSSDGQSFTLFAVGTMTGTFTLWVTDHPNPNMATDADWVQDTGITFTNPAGSDTKFNDSASNMKQHWKRVKYVNATGSGVLRGYCSVVNY